MVASNPDLESTCRAPTCSSASCTCARLQVALSTTPVSNCLSTRVTRRACVKTVQRNLSDLAAPYHTWPIRGRDVGSSNNRIGDSRISAPAVAHHASPCFTVQETAERIALNTKPRALARASRCRSPPDLCVGGSCSPERRSSKLAQNVSRTAALLLSQPASRSLGACAQGSDPVPTWGAAQVPQKAWPLLLV